MKILFKLINKKTLTVNWDYVYKLKQFSILKHTKQSQKWHAEGNVNIHTENVVNEIYKLIPEFNDKQLYNRRLILVAAALFHDIGKGVTTVYNEKSGTYTSYNHDIEGEKIARKMLWDEDIEIREKICTLVRNHMIPLRLNDSNKKYELIKLSMENVTIEDLLTLKMADCNGSIHEEYDYWKEKLKDLENFSLKINCFRNRYNFSNKNEECFFIKNGKLPKPNDNVGKIDFVVYMLIGLPGSGKTTYYKSQFYNMPIVSRDMIRIDLGIPYNSNGNCMQEKQVDEIFDKKVKDFASKKSSFIVDNTNLKKSYRDHIKLLLSEYNVEYRYFYIESPNIKFNLNRRFKGIIQTSFILRMRNEFDFPRGTNSFTGELINIGSKEYFQYSGITVNRDINGARNILLRAMRDSSACICSNW